MPTAKDMIDELEKRMEEKMKQAIIGLKNEIWDDLLIMESNIEQCDDALGEAVDRIKRVVDTNA